MKIFVNAKPRTKKPSITKTGDRRFVVAVAEPAKDDRANRAVIRALADHLGVVPSRIQLISGMSSRQKVFEIV